MKNTLDDLTICHNVASEMASLVGNEKIVDGFANTPKETMEYALSKARPELKKDFASGVGLWEGFTLAEHTESVMLFFQENFADTCPCDKETRAMMNLIIFCHDIGKAEEKRKYGTISPRDKYDLYWKKTVMFLNDLKLKQKDIQNLALFITTLTQPMERVTTSYYIDKNWGALDLLDEYSASLLEKCQLGTNQENVDGLSVMARVLQTCDGGAYTIFGKTRDAKTNTYRPNINEEWSLGFNNTEKGYRFNIDALQIYEKDCQKF